MKVRYWMAVYPFQMAEGAMKPYVYATPLECPPGARVLTFDVEVPDTLFGIVATETSVVTEEKPK